MEMQFGYFTERLWTKVPPVIEPEHTSFFHADIAESNKVGDPQDRNQEPLRIIKNIYAMPDLFRAGTNLVGSRVVCEIVQNYANVTICPVVIDKAYLYPFKPGDDSYENDKYPVLEQDSSVSQIFIEQYVCDPPDIELFRIVPRRIREIVSNECDLKTVRTNNDWDRGIRSWNIQYSKTLIDKYGLLVSYGYVMSLPLYEALEKYIDTIYYWRTTFLY